MISVVLQPVAAKNDLPARTDKQTADRRRAINLAFPERKKGGPFSWFQ